jgi:hypothetical protein
MKVKRKLIVAILFAMFFGCGWLCESAHYHIFKTQNALMASNREEVLKRVRKIQRIVADIREFNDGIEWSVAESFPTDEECYSENYLATMGGIAYLTTVVDNQTELIESELKLMILDIKGLS